MPTAVRNATRKLTWDDYVRLPDDGRRHEIMDGVHYVSASPFIDHQRISRHIHFQLYRQIELTGRGEVFNAPTDLHLSEFAYVTEQKVEGPPDLVVEIVSPSSARRDRVMKLDRYERAGVGEYWIVDPVARQVDKYRRAGASLASAGRFRDRVSFDGLDGVSVDLSSVWQRLPDRRLPDRRDS